MREKKTSSVSLGLVLWVATRLVFFSNFDAAFAKGKTAGKSAIDKEIAAAVTMHKEDIHHCYDREIKDENQGMPGIVYVNFEISEKGRVSYAEVDSNTLNNKNLETCILKIIRKLRFTRPKDVGSIKVERYAFKFGSEKQGTGTSQE